MAQLNRREFLVNTALLGAGIAAASLPLGAYATAGAEGAKLANGTSAASLRRKIRQFEVFPIGLGCMNAAWGFGEPMSIAEGGKLFRQAFEDGQNFFDTAEAYGPWTSEEMVGVGLKGVRDKAVIATKFGFALDDKGKITGLNSRPDNIRKVVDESLKRLQTDYIDLLYQHRVDPNVPIEDVAGTVNDLIKQGKVRAFGLSEAGEATIRRAHREQAVVALQNEYSVWSRDPEEEVLAVCEELGIALVPWSPLGKGYLAGTITPQTEFYKGNEDVFDRRAGMPRFTPAARAANGHIIEALRQIAQRHNATPAQISLAWLLHRKPFIVPIPGTTNPAHQRENMMAATIRLDAQDMAALENLKVTGSRGADGVMVLIEDGAKTGTSSKGTQGSTPPRR